MIKFISITLLILFAGTRVIAQTETNNANLKTAGYGTAGTEGIKAWVTQAESTSPRFGLQIYNPAGKRVRITLDGSDYQNLQTDSFTGKTYSRIYNLSEMEDGTYSFKIVCGTERITKNVVIRTETTSRRIIEVK